MSTLLELKPLASRLWDKTKNTAPIESIDSNDDKEYYWTCKRHGHSFKMSPKDIPNDSRFCPYHTRLLIPGLNDLRTVDPVIAGWLADDLNGTSADGIKANSEERLWWRDPLHHDHVWRSSLSNRRGQRSGCPICSGHVLLSGVNDMATMDPVESEMMDEGRNHGLTPDKVRYGSNAKIWWRCPRGHSFLKSPAWMKNNDNKCEQCEMEDSLSIAAMYPDLVPWFDNDQNEDSVKHTPAKTMTQVHWRCPRGHTFTMRPYDIEHAHHKCVRCYGKVKKRVVEGINDLASQRPDLLQQWVNDRNEDDPNTVRLTSDKEYWWACKEHPRHLFKCSVNRMSKMAKNQCPYCRGDKTLVGFNDLFTVIPEFKGIWDYENNTVDPLIIRVRIKGTGVMYSNDGLLSWKCSRGHHWKSKLSDLRRGKREHCPYCLNKLLKKGFNDVKSRYPELLNEWDYEKNKYLPEDTFYDRGIVHMKCKRGHEWTRQLRYYTGVHDHNTLCPECPDKDLIVGKNDIATIIPALAKEWDWEKNIALDPSHVNIRYGDKVWWICSKGHEWKAYPKTRIISIKDQTFTGCPKCSWSSQSSPGEDLIEKWVRNVSDTEIIRNAHHVLPGREELDLYLPNLNVGIEYNGVYWHSIKGKHIKEYHFNKYKQASDAGIRLAQFWDDDVNRKPEASEYLLDNILGVSNNVILDRDDVTYGFCDLDRDNKYYGNKFIDKYRLTPRRSQPNINQMAIFSSSENDSICALVEYEIIDSSLYILDYTEKPGYTVHNGLKNLIIEIGCNESYIDHVFIDTNNLYAGYISGIDHSLLRNPINLPPECFIRTRRSQMERMYDWKMDPEKMGEVVNLVYSGLTLEDAASKIGELLIYDAGKTRWEVDI